MDDGDGLWSRAALQKHVEETDRLSSGRGRSALVVSKARALLEAFHGTAAPGSPSLSQSVRMPPTQDARAKTMTGFQCHSWARVIGTGLRESPAAVLVTLR